MDVLALLAVVSHYAKKEVHGYQFNPTPWFQTGADKKKLGCK